MARKSTSGGGRRRPNGSSSSLGPNRRNVTRRPDGRWKVTRPGANRASAVEDTQHTAIKRARELLQNDGGGELTIHRPNGQIRDADTVAPGHDPNPPRDAK